MPVNANIGFEAKMDHASLLKKIIEAIKDLLGECTWDCTNTGMSLQSMDSSHVALVNVMLKCEGFERYKCDRNLNMGINLSSMAKVLRCAGPDDSVAIKTDGDSSSASFIFESPDGDRSAEFELKLMNIDVEHLGIPDTAYDCIIKMPSQEFRRVCADLSQFGDSVTISCAKADVRFEAQGDIGTGHIRLGAKSGTVEKPEDEISIELENPVTLTFALKYLNNFAKATPLSPTVRLCMSNNHPLCIEYPMVEVGHIRYYLAPKIEEETE
ncbi:proliferating cell nuclear antigen-like [Paramacrobiotus metropolitanus]|uniref:proliferating cell nuclear antigen-like n=1 Tax=Paramacrobiotus metropolitanus TaxID=2943436 RepID=UPI0024460BE2|nr:proliferating cell nuclear antigen-like [Paramacrobiotus metropolitanus]XP_055356069.1 proliferating cell nuclear antigen-like [Paramacrobiotus metropolitanus]XP_055356086.1 proliferating cell nuclear antigen-like [Paramacrobiotus metropolitanus]XP_055356087.1 proliferating cell nuclear antigen-like [Paramacrobiotus metropolitanus]XP_055356088.1 proliferating cell nuclear antigen-like [Paramacrobiotus metropolitanus]